MAAQGERVLGAIGMDGGLLDPMAQDKEVEQEMLVVEEEEQFFPPQMDTEPEMGTAAGAESDTPPPLLRQNPSPVPSEAAADRGDSAEINRVGEMLMRMMQGMENRMNENMEKKMDGMAQTVREEMQCMGAGLQEGQEQLKGEIGKSMTAVREFKKGQEELRRATCWGRLAEVTEEVTVTETCTREIRHVEVTEYAETREITEIGERLHGVEEEEDAHTYTHTGSEGQWG